MEGEDADGSQVGPVPNTAFVTVHSLCAGFRKNTCCTGTLSSKRRG